MHEQREVKYLFSIQFNNKSNIYTVYMKRKDMRKYIYLLDINREQREYKDRETESNEDIK